MNCDYDQLCLRCGFEKCVSVVIVIRIALSDSFIAFMSPLSNRLAFGCSFSVGRLDGRGRIVSDVALSLSTAFDFASTV